MTHACNKLDEGKVQFDKNHFPEAISACQECIEFSIKAVFHFAEVKFPPEHTFMEENFKRVLQKIRKCTKQKDLERMYMISAFWSSMYGIAKYGCEKIGVGPERLFKKREAWFALLHAYEVYDQASNIYYDCAPEYYGKSSHVKTVPTPNFSLSDLKL